MFSETPELTYATIPNQRWKAEPISWLYMGSCHPQTLTYPHTFKIGSCFGEMALMTAQPRSASVVCASAGGCVVDEISAEDFTKLLTARQTGFRRDFTRMLRARQFRHGVYKLVMELGNDSTFTDEVLKSA